MVMEAVIQAQTKEQLVNFVQSKFISEFKNKPDLIKLAPGRINIIGEHTDYNNGLAMPAAIDRWVCVALSQYISFVQGKVDAISRNSDTDSES